MHIIKKRPTNESKMEKPNDQLLTKIDAIILRAYEMDSNFHKGDLEEYIEAEFDVVIDVNERLKIYYNEDTGFAFTLN